MNKLQGTISEIISEGHLSLLKIDVGDNFVSSIVVDTPATAPYLQTGNRVNVLFKENEVAIAKSFSGQISLQNKFDGVVKSIERGKLLSKITLKYGNSDIVSLITTHAAEQMDLKPGDHVTAMVKTNEISLSPYD